MMTKDTYCNSLREVISNSKCSIARSLKSLMLDSLAQLRYESIVESLEAEFFKKEFYSMVLNSVEDCSELEEIERVFRLYGRELKRGVPKDEDLASTAKSAAIETLEIFANCIRRQSKSHKGNELINLENKHNMEKQHMLFPEIATKEFDFNTLLKETTCSTMCGLPVKVDRILRDVTNTTVIGISGTMIVRGIKIRGVWDGLGNIMECKKTLQLASPKKMMTSLDNIFEGTTNDMFRLVRVESVKEGSE